MAPPTKLEYRGNLTTFKDFLLAMHPIIVMLFLSVLSYGVICHLVERALAFTRQPYFGNYFQLFTSFLLYQGFPFRTHSLSNQILVVTFAFAGMIIVCFFYADFKTSLIIENEGHLINSLQDVLAVKPPLNVLITNSCGAKDIFQRKETPEHAAIFELAEAWDRKMGKVDTRQLRADRKDELLKGRFCGIDVEPVLLVMSRMWCALGPEAKLHLSKNTIAEVLIGIPYRKSLPETITNNIKEKLKCAVESGIIFHLYEKTFEDWPQCFRPSSDGGDAVQNLSLEALTKTFTFWAIGLAISTLVFMYEIGYWFYTRGGQAN